MGSTASPVLPVEKLDSTTALDYVQLGAAIGSGNPVTAALVGWKVSQRDDASADQSSKEDLIDYAIIGSSVASDDPFSAAVAGYRIATRDLPKVPLEQATDLGVSERKFALHGSALTASVATLGAGVTWATFEGVHTVQAASLPGWVSSALTNMGVSVGAWFGVGAAAAAGLTMASAGRAVGNLAALALVRPTDAERNDPAGASVKTDENGETERLKSRRNAVSGIVGTAVSIAGVASFYALAQRFSGHDLGPALLVGYASLAVGTLYNGYHAISNIKELASDVSSAAARTWQRIAGRTSQESEKDRSTAPGNVPDGTVGTPSPLSLRIHGNSSGSHATEQAERISKLLMPEDHGSVSKRSKPPGP